MVSIGDHGTLIDSKKCEKIGNEGHGMVRYSNSALPCSVSYNKENCDATIDWEEVEVLAKIHSRSKKQASYKLDYMESFCIKLHQTGLGKGFNEDEGRRVFTKQWDPLLAQLRQKMNLG